MANSGRPSIAVALLFLALDYSAASTDKPNIVLIIADDLGWNDVGFHGSSQIPTPNIDALAYSGLVLNNYYVGPICTPSRSALMTGRHPIHTGMQHSVLLGGERRGLNLSEKLLPQYLEEAGYSRHLVGKWHLGSFKEEYTPTRRGFQTHFGYWTGHQDYYDHTAMESNFWGLDMRSGMEPGWKYHGRYSTDLYTDEAVRIIQEHGARHRQHQQVPLFLCLAHVAVHSGNPYNPLPVPDKLAASFQNITSDYNRQRFAGMLTKLDDSVGAVVAALGKAGMLGNTLIAFTTDNGGPAAGFNLNAASNWPLRGVKNTLWEGGVRGVGLLWGRMVKRPARVATQLIHITDWLPTLLSAAGIPHKDLPELDGLDLWSSLSQNTASPRDRVLHNIDDIYGSSALTLNGWKLVKGTNYGGAWDGWYGPSGRDTKYRYDTEAVIRSTAARAMAAIGVTITKEQILGMRQQAEVNCEANEIGTPCRPLNQACLFNINNDPCETNNLAQKFPDVLAELETLLAVMNSTAVAPANLPVDPIADPDNWDHVWTNFGDYDRRHSPPHLVPTRNLCRSTRA